jgi:hypothetical protein
LKVEIIPAKREHIAHIASNVRETDRRELYDYVMMTPQEALERSFVSSRMAWTGLIDGVPCVMFGVVSASFLSETGRPWMIATSQIENYQLTFLRRCKPVVKKMTLCYQRLENYVAEYNTKAIAWLKWMSFKFDKEPVKMGLFNKDFYRFSMEQ